MPFNLSPEGSNESLRSVRTPDGKHILPQLSKDALTDTTTSAEKNALLNASGLFRLKNKDAKGWLPMISTLKKGGLGGDGSPGDPQSQTRNLPEDSPQVRRNSFYLNA
jgi:hypothetical protein